MSMANMSHNAMPMEASMTLMVHVLINGKEILLQALCNKEVTKGVFMGWTKGEPKRLQDLNETTFLAIYAVGILAEGIGTAIEKINNWLGKSVVITCNEVTTAQLTHVLDSVQHISGVELVFLTTEWMICILTHFRVFRGVTIVRQPAPLHWEP